MKKYVLTVSKQFPKTHKKAGLDTGFVSAIKNLFSPESTKIHTIRHNYDLWTKRAKEINDGKAILSIRYWSGKPYNSNQVEICRLEKIGIEKLENPTVFLFAPIEGRSVNWEDVAKNDGLSFDDFCDWFKIRTSSPMAIIHFTDFRYAPKIDATVCR